METFNTSNEIVPEKVLQVISVIEVLYIYGSRNSDRQVIGVK